MINVLPIEIVLHILSFIKDPIFLSQTCKYLKEIIYSDFAKIQWNNRNKIKLLEFISDNQNTNINFYLKDKIYIAVRYLKCACVLVSENRKQEQTFQYINTEILAINFYPKTFSKIISLYGPRVKNFLSMDLSFNYLADFFVDYDFKIIERRAIFLRECIFQFIKLSNKDNIKILLEKLIKNTSFLCKINHTYRYEKVDSISIETRIKLYESIFSPFLQIMGVRILTKLPSVYQNINYIDVTVLYNKKLKNVSAVTIRQLSLHLENYYQVNYRKARKCDEFLKLVNFVKSYKLIMVKRHLQLPLFQKN